MRFVIQRRGCQALLDHKPGRVLVCGLDRNHEGICKPVGWRATTRSEERRLRRERVRAEQREAR